MLPVTTDTLDRGELRYIEPREDPEEDLLVRGEGIEGGP